MLDLGRNVTFADPQSLDDALYPLGYPLLLCVAIQQGIDVLRFGQFLSCIGGLLVLLGVPGIIYRLTRSLLLALAGILLLGTNLIFLQYATFEGNRVAMAAPKIQRPTHGTDPGAALDPERSGATRYPCRMVPRTGTN